MSLKERHSGGAPGSVTVGTTTTTVVEARPAREYLSVHNNGSAVVYLALGADAEMNKGIRLPSGGSYEINYTNLFVGEVNAISSASTVVCFQEG
jgi:hypothetical protein